MARVQLFVERGKESSLPYGLDCRAGSNCQCRKRDGAPKTFTAYTTAAQFTKSAKAQLTPKTPDLVRNGTKPKTKHCHPLTICHIIATFLLTLLFLQSKIWIPVELKETLSPLALYVAFTGPGVNSSPLEVRVMNLPSDQSSDLMNDKSSSSPPKSKENVLEYSQDLLKAIIKLQPQFQDIRRLVKDLQRRRRISKEPANTVSASFLENTEGESLSCDSRYADTLRSTRLGASSSGVSLLNSLRVELLGMRQALSRLQRLQRRSSVSQCPPSPQLPPPPPPPPLPPPPSPFEDLPDFASETAGGAIVATPQTVSYVSDARETLWGIPLWRVVSSPRSIIQAAMEPGACWAFRGAEGRAVVALAAAARLAAVSVEHLPAGTAPAGGRASAPRAFAVTGLRAPGDTLGVPLGSFEYALGGPPRQTFALDEPTREKFPAVMLHVISNHGNAEYTCVYRFRVHGYVDSGADTVHSFVN